MTVQTCFRFNLRSIMGVFMTTLGSLYLTVWPIITIDGTYKGVEEQVMNGWPAIVVIAGAMLLAWGEFCQKGDC